MSLGGRLFLATLATFRVTWSLIFDDGPWGVFLKLRTKLGVYDYGEQRGPDGQMIPRGEMGKWANCKYCVSLFPVSFVFVILAFVDWLPITLMLAWLGIAGAVAILFRWRNW